MKTVLPTLLLLSAAHLLSADGNWPNYRGPAKDGTVDRQWMNHLTVKFTLSIPWLYGYFAKDGV